ncbi:HNH endonuclease [Sulfurovum sp. AR]|uniref:HNH endonuclease n=1 Tax=Sulfurovum sp. AR TaxID=1165841 RepID=UPI00025C4D4C|nr:HNH endonuclease signature motif containing protein [Sulfurovum sp. AR]EIF51392.1 HNH endonuclease [Sulfurovum sp. AR]
MEHAFIKYVAKGSNSNTYKFALAKFLLDYSRSKKIISDCTISYNEIATKFLEYYWFQECKYKFKQDFNKDKMPVVIRLIQKYCGTEYIPETYEKYFQDKKDIQKKLISDIEKQCFKDVIPRFQSDGENPFYMHFHQISESERKFMPPQTEKRHIILNYKALSFFKEEYETLTKILILEWAKFLEKTNFTPRLISKIELMKDPKRNSLNKFRKILLEMDNKCFYCGESFDNKTIHIDHFIPWSYIYEDEIWNLVQACSNCNLIKSDALPPKQYIQKITTRNENHGLLKWNRDINEYYENCFKAGFKIINEEKLECKSAI